jgi:hypothetical protein
MPNHIQNRLEIIGDQLQVNNVRSFIKGNNDSQIDFNKIIPMPEELGGEINSLVVTAAKYALKMELSSNPLLGALQAMNRDKADSPLSFSEEDWKHFIQCLNNARNHGFVYWYDWSVANWGTEWNAYQTPDERDTENIIFYQTAWSSSEKIVMKLSGLFPELRFKLSYADEASGSNVGVITFQAGKTVLFSRIKNQSKEAYELYFELHPGRQADYKLVGETYEYTA